MHIFQFNSMLVWTVFKIIMIFSPNFNDLLWVTAVIFKIGIKISARPPKCPRSPWREWGQCFRNKMHFTLVVSLPACREELLSKLKEYKTFCVIAGMLCVIDQLFVSQKKTVKSVCTPGVWNHWNDDKRGYGCGARLEMKPALFWGQSQKLWLENELASNYKLNDCLHV